MPTGIPPANLLAVLYPGASRPRFWPRFPVRPGGLLDAPPATLRLLDVHAPVVHRFHGGRVPRPPA